MARFFIQNLELFEKQKSNVENPQREFVRIVRISQLEKREMLYKEWFVQPTKLLALSNVDQKLFLYFAYQFQLPKCPETKICQLIKKHALTFDLFQSGLPPITFHSKSQLSSPRKILRQYHLQFYHRHDKSSYSNENTQMLFDKNSAFELLIKNIQLKFLRT